MIYLQTPASSHDVVLAWSLQSALSAGLAVACGGLALTFRRPAMRVLAVFWTLLTVAAAFIWGALSGQSFGLTASAGPLFAAFAFVLTPSLAFVLARHLLLLLSCKTDRAFPPVSVLLMTGVGAFLFAFGLQQLTASRDVPGTVPVTAIMSSAATIVAYAILAMLARTAFMAAREHRNAVKLLGTSFLLLAIRSTTNLAVAALSARRGEMPSFGIEVTTVQISLLVIAGVFQLMAVLDEERASIVHRAEQIRHAESAMARSERLESLGRMAGAVAHDFNNVLAVIAMSAESAREAKSDSREEDLREILASSKRGQDLTRQLLSFARQTPQQVTRFDVNHQLDKLNGLLQRMVGKSAAFTLSVAPTPQLVEMDVTQFEQVMMNLAVNARDAMPLGGSVAVSVAPSAPFGDANAPFVRLSVTDTGTGIPADVLPHIFEPFFSTKTAGEGSGLGLATCDGIVRRSGGRIDVTTEAGKGTRFEVLIPKATA